MIRASFWVGLLKATLILSALNSMVYLQMNSLLSSEDLVPPISMASSKLLTNIYRLSSDLALLASLIYLNLH
ncbi:MAG: hypothetical protein V7638_2312 [Acidobacteriota bacterium]